MVKYRSTAENDDIMTVLMLFNILLCYLNFAYSYLILVDKLPLPKMSWLKNSCHNLNLWCRRRL